MGVNEVREYFAVRDLPYEIREMDESTETVELAAKALGVQPALIAKTLAFKMNNRGIIIVTRGDARVDSKKFKQAFQAKPKMMSADDVFEMTGHKVGGVCPFGLKQALEIFLDVSLKPFDKVYPAAGSPNSYIEITPEDLFRITGAQWVDVCRDDRAL
jgi:Cys-tRNA(Pro) deacylase